jgi:hypothetical protein
MIIEIAKTLDELRFEPHIIYEAIITTESLNGEPNAAPMGIIRRNKEEVQLMPFKTSKTHENLRTKLKACINITSKTGLYLVTAFKGFFFEDLETPIIDKKLRLSPSDAHIFLEVKTDESVSDLKTSFICEVKEIEVINPFPTIFSRVKAKTIDAIIHATRIKVYVKKGDKSMVDDLIGKFLECKEFVMRTSAPNSEEIKVINYLCELIDENFLLKNNYNGY